jgi:LuxR family transcriptional regulator
MQISELMMDPSELGDVAPAGFYVAIRIGFAFPMVELNHLPASWVREYTTSGLMVHDPAMSWAYSNAGVARWSDLVASDRLGVLDLAKNHGLEYGAVVSCVDGKDCSAGRIASTRRRNSPGSPSASRTATGSTPGRRI